MNSVLLDARYQSIVDLLQSSDAEFDENKFCEPCLRYNVPSIIPNANWQKSALKKFISEDPQVIKWLGFIGQHATENPLFNENEKWKIDLDDEKLLGTSSQQFDESKVSELCSEANLPGGLDDDLKTNLCWIMNRYAFDAVSDRPEADEKQVFFTTWRLIKRD
jgi:hypothetical protein